MTFFVALNPKRQQVAWYGVPKKLLDEMRSEELKKKREVEPELDLNAFIDSYSQEKERIRVYKLKVRKQRSAEAAQVMMMLLGE